MTSTAVRRGLHGLLQVPTQTQSDVEVDVEAPAATTLYDKEETAKRQNASPSVPPGIEAAASLQQPQQQQLPPLHQLHQLHQLQLGAVGGLLPGGPLPLGPLGPHGLLGSGMMHLKYTAHPSLRMPLASPVMAHGPTLPLSMPRPLTPVYKHALKHGIMPIMHRHPLGHGLGPNMPSLPGYMARRPGPVLQQTPRPQTPPPGMILSSPSQHNYIIKKKPLFRVPMGMSGVPVLSSTTLRPLYLPSVPSPNMFSSTLKPSITQSLMAAQVAHQQQQHQQQQQYHHLHQQQQQLYSASKLHKLAAALSTVTPTTTSTTTTTTTTTTPIPLTDLGPVHIQHYRNQDQSVQTFPAYYRPLSNSFPAVSPAFDVESLQEGLQSTSVGSLSPLAPLAVNTGFNPSSVVVEGGFKPILQRRQDEAEDRMAFVEGGDDGGELMEGSVLEMERRSSDVVIEDQDEDVEEVNEDRHAPHQHEQERRTETFEPMFIPSPPDRNSFKAGVGGVGVKKASEPGKALPLSKQDKPASKPGKPGKLGRRDKPARLTPLIVRPRPAILRRPLYPNMVVPPFKIQAQSRRGHHEKLEPEMQPEAEVEPHKDSGHQQEDRTEEKDNEDDDLEQDDETMMAAERMDTYYLPPSAPTQPHIILTYDGKTVDPAVAASIPNPPPDAIHSPSSADLVRSTPQFGPFLGEAPPPVPTAPSPLDLPQLQPQQVQQVPLGQHPPLQGLPGLPLSVIGGEEGERLDDQLTVIQAPVPEQEQDALQTNASDHLEQHEPDRTADVGRAKRELRERRSPEPHHEPGHDGDDYKLRPGAASNASPALVPHDRIALSILCAMLVSAWSADRRFSC